MKKKTLEIKVTPTVWSGTPAISVWLGAEEISRQYISRKTAEEVQQILKEMSREETDPQLLRPSGMDRD